MRNGIRMELMVPLAAVLCFACLRTVSASTFILDPTESYLTIDGSSSGKPASPQTPGSLTTSLTGSLQIGQYTLDTLRIAGSMIDYSGHAGPFTPLGTAADFAGQVDNFSNGQPAYFAARNSHSHLWGNLPTAGSSGQYSTTQLKMSFNTPEMVGKRPYDYYIYGEGVSKTLDMTLTGPAALSAVERGFRVEIPILSSSFQVLSKNLEMRLIGKLVGYSDFDPRLTPEIVDGSFQLRHGWFDPDPRSLTRIDTVYEQSTYDGFHEVGSATLFTASGTLTRLAQEVMGPGMLLPDTLYEVHFDVGNGVDEQRSSPVRDIDLDASVDVYFSLGGLTRSGDYDAAGGAYRLEQLSDIPDEEWRRGESFLFDTSHLTPDQLAQGVYIVLQASTIGSQRSEVRFDNVRVAIVPEPSSLLLALSAGTVGLMFARLRRQRSRLNVFSQRA